MARINTQLWVQAHIRKCFFENIPAFILAKGDKERGGILLKINRFADGCALLQPTTNMDGAWVWGPVTNDETVDESIADGIIRKRRQYDTDLWVLEIEDRDSSYTQPDQY